MFIDVHCHLTGEEYDLLGGADGVIASAKQRGVGLMICSGFDLPSSLQAQKIAARHEDVYFCAGFQPEEIGGYQGGDLDEIKSLALDEKCVAIGEIGLDYHFENNPPKDWQKELFERQLILADEVGLPVVVHSRDACADTLEILERNKARLKRGGVMHCYSYSPECVPMFERLGMYFSFGGTLTFKNARKTKESAKAASPQRVLTETDCPYLAPEPLRGKFPNTPENVVHTTKYLSELWGKEEEYVKRTMEENAKRLFFKIGRN